MQHECDVRLCGDPVRTLFVPPQLAVGRQLVLGVAIHNEGERTALRKGPEVEVNGLLLTVGDPVVVEGIGFEAIQGDVVERVGCAIGRALVKARVCYVIRIGCVLHCYVGRIEVFAFTIVPIVVVLVRYGPQGIAGVVPSVISAAARAITHAAKSNNVTITILSDQFLVIINNHLFSSRLPPRGGNRLVLTPSPPRTCSHCQDG